MDSLFHAEYMNSEDTTLLYVAQEVESFPHRGFYSQDPYIYISIYMIGYVICKKGVLSTSLNQEKEKIYMLKT